ncbi:MAG: hypothetical protein LUC47_03255 [Clostridiales bacterium]|nr:hypothetical protein [Clostridiales bacterium]
MKKKEKKAKNGVKKPLYKKWWFWVIVVVILVVAFGGSSSSSEDQSDNTESSAVEAVSSVEENATAAESTADEENSVAEESTSSAESETVETTTSSEENEAEEENTESHIYDDATIRNVMNGYRTEKLGEYSIVYISSDEATVENLTDWYYNYVTVNDYNWCMIRYTDSDENKGAYAITGMVEKDVFFEQDEYGDYSMGDSSQETLYLPQDGTLVDYND